MSKSINYTERSVLTEYFNSLEKTAGKENLAKYLNGEYSYDENAPFLSVIMRTQGKRPEALGEVLLCLCGQSDTDFEVLIMGHNLDEAGKKSVDTIIDELPSSMDGKVRLVEVKGGSRTTPLNEGFKAAKGRYVSILDDDDLVLENWVESFHILEADNRGKILHTYCVAQDWESVKNEYGETVLVSTSAFHPLYCCEFDLIRQFSTNFCPTFSLAFPSVTYDLLGIHFDETLTTTEDWDFLMRNALICGVADNPTVTGIYRKWTNSESSATLHDQGEWRKNHKYIQKKLLADSFLLPHKASAELFSTQGGMTNSGGVKTNEFMVLIDDGSGFASNMPLKMSFLFEDEKWTAKVTNLEDFGEIRRIRIDPVHEGTVTLKGLELKLTDGDGNRVGYRHDKIRTNGVYSGDSIIFLGLDPQCVFVLDRPTKLSDLAIEFCIDYDVPLNFFRTTVIRYCFKRWTRGILKRMRDIAVKIKTVIK